MCCEWRRVVESSVGRACATRRSLVDLGATALLTDVVDALALTPITVKLYPHRTKRRYGGGVYRIFAQRTCVDIYRAHGGANGLERRLARRAKRAVAPIA